MLLLQRAGFRLVAPRPLRRAPRRLLQLRRARLGFPLAVPPVLLPPQRLGFHLAPLVALPRPPLLLRARRRLGPLGAFHLVPPVQRPPLERPPLERPPLERPPLERPPLERPPLERPLPHPLRRFHLGQHHRARQPPRPRQGCHLARHRVLLGRQQPHPRAFLSAHPPRHQPRCQPRH